MLPKAHAVGTADGFRVYIALRPGTLKSVEHMETPMSILEHGNPWAQRKVLCLPWSPDERSAFDINVRRFGM